MLNMLTKKTGHDGGIIPGYKNKATHMAVGGFEKDVERPDYSGFKNFQL